jgi:hypothetical protein
MFVEKELISYLIVPHSAFTELDGEPLLLSEKIFSCVTITAQIAQSKIRLSIHCCSLARARNDQTDSLALMEMKTIVAHVLELATTTC